MVGVGVGEGLGVGGEVWGGRDSFNLLGSWRLSWGGGGV